MTRGAESSEPCGFSGYTAVNQGAGRPTPYCVYCNSLWNEHLPKYRKINDSKFL
jgi:hypothetical protein